MVKSFVVYLAAGLAVTSALAQTYSSGDPASANPLTSGYVATPATAPASAAKGASAQTNDGGQASSANDATSQTVSTGVATAVRSPENSRTVGYRAASVQSDSARR